MGDGKPGATSTHVWIYSRNVESGVWALGVQRSPVTPVENLHGRAERMSLLHSNSKCQGNPERGLLGGSLALCCPKCSFYIPGELVPEMQNFSPHL